MSNSSNSTGTVRAAGKANTAATPSGTAILRCDDHADLAGVLQPLRTVAPELLPSTLPSKVVIKPNLCDVLSSEAGVAVDPAWLPVLAAELRAIRPDVRIVVVEPEAVSAYQDLRPCEETFDRLGYREIARQHDIELRQAAKDLGRQLPEVALAADSKPRAFAFHRLGHRTILLKFANKRWHRASEVFANRWIDRFLRFKREPLKFAREAIPKLARRLHAR